MHLLVYLMIKIYIYNNDTLIFKLKFIFNLISLAMKVLIKIENQFIHVIYIIYNLIVGNNLTKFKI